MVLLYHNNLKHHLFYVIHNLHYHPIPQIPLQHLHKHKDHVLHKLSVQSQAHRVDQVGTEVGVVPSEVGEAHRVDTEVDKEVVDTEVDKEVVDTEVGTEVVGTEVDKEVGTEVDKEVGTEVGTEVVDMEGDMEVDMEGDMEVDKEVYPHYSLAYTHRKY